MLQELEGFMKARKRDKNDQNALIRNLQSKVKEQENMMQYNRKAVENVGTSVILNFLILYLDCHDIRSALDDSSF
jgi:hypothetical protein